jgi:hypothetical protein
VRARSDHGHRDWEHADDREAQGRVDHAGELHLQPEHAQDGGAEHDDGDAAQHPAQLFGEGGWVDCPTRDSPVERAADRGESLDVSFAASPCSARATAPDASAVHAPCRALNNETRFRMIERQRFVRGQ